MKMIEVEFRLGDRVRWKRRGQVMVGNVIAIHCTPGARTYDVQCDDKPDKLPRRQEGMLECDLTAVSLVDPL